MNIYSLHPWNVTPEEAKRIQHDLRGRVSTKNEIGAVRHIAGVDIGVKNDTARAAVVIVRYPGLDLLDVSLVEKLVTFPYIPGLLSFRESPSMLDALQQLSVDPDLILVDGQGIAHPRRLGIASHLGLLTGIPTVGCAKTRLWGHHEQPDIAAGSFTHLYDGSDIIGAVVRTKTATNPLYVSIGHKVDLPTAIRYVLDCCRGYRLPEPTRLAHQAAGGTLPPRHTDREGDQLSLFPL
jgi:deoxyribonuclease V